MSEHIRIDDDTVFNPSTGELGSLPEIAVTASVTLIEDDSPISIEWNILKASSCRLNSEEIPNQGRKEIVSDGELKLLFVAENSFGQSERELIIPIDTSPPIINSFRADSNFAITGSPNTLRWDISKSKRIEIDNSIGDVSGKDFITVTTGSIGVYRLKAYSFFNYCSQAEITITIFPTPLVEGIFIPEPKFIFSKISENQPQFVNSCNVDLNTKISLPELTPLDYLGSKILLEDGVITTNSRHGIFRVFIELQKEIINKINYLWRFRR